MADGSSVFGGLRPNHAAAAAARLRSASGDRLWTDHSDTICRRTLATIGYTTPNGSAPSVPTTACATSASSASKVASRARTISARSASGWFGGVGTATSSVGSSTGSSGTDSATIPDRLRIGRAALNFRGMSANGTLAAVAAVLAAFDRW